MRRTQPDLHRGFKAPWVPVTPIIAIAFCIVLIAGLNWETWLRFLVWLAFGMILYFSYGRRHADAKF